jgi:DNA-binding transcriptional ArsR family regulator
MNAPLREPRDAVDARVVKALSHPTRVRILELLQQRELASPVELSAVLGTPLGTVSYHVRRLEQLGFIELATRTQRRGAVEHHYRVRAALDQPRRPRRRQDAPAEGSAESTAISSTLDDAQRALSHGGFDAVEARADSRMLLLDERGSREARALMARWSRTLDRVERSSARRLERANGSVAGVRDASALVLLFALED